MNNRPRHFDFFGGRRFIMAMGCGAVSAALLWVGKLDPSTYRDIILGTIASYIAGNTAQKFRGPQ